MYTLRQATEQDRVFLYQLHVVTMREYVTATLGWHEEWQRDYFQQKWDPVPRRIIQIRGQDAEVVVINWLEDSIKLELIELLPGIQRQQGLRNAREKIHAIQNNH